MQESHGNLNRGYQHGDNLSHWAACPENWCVGDAGNGSGGVTGGRCHNLLNLSAAPVACSSLPSGSKHVANASRSCINSGTVPGASGGSKRSNYAHNWPIHAIWVKPLPELKPTHCGSGKGGVDSTSATCRNETDFDETVNAVYRGGGILDKYVDLANNYKTLINGNLRDPKSATERRINNYKSAETNFNNAVDALKCNVCPNNYGNQTFSRHDWATGDTDKSKPGFNKVCNDDSIPWGNMKFNGVIRDDYATDGGKLPCSAENSSKSVKAAFKNITEGMDGISGPPELEYSASMFGWKDKLKDYDTMSESERTQLGMGGNNITPMYIKNLYRTSGGIHTAIGGGDTRHNNVIEPESPFFQITSGDYTTWRNSIKNSETSLAERIPNQFTFNKEKCTHMNTQDYTDSSHKDGIKIGGEHSYYYYKINYPECKPFTKDPATIYGINSGDGNKSYVRYKVHNVYNTATTTRLNESAQGKIFYYLHDDEGKNSIIDVNNEEIKNAHFTEDPLSDGLEDLYKQSAMVYWIDLYYQSNIALNTINYIDIPEGTTPPIEPRKIKFINNGDVTQYDFYYDFKLNSNSIIEYPLNTFGFTTVWGDDNDAFKIRYDVEADAIKALNSSQTFIGYSKIPKGRGNGNSSSPYFLMIPHRPINFPTANIKHSIAQPEVNGYFTNNNIGDAYLNWAIIPGDADDKNYIRGATSDWTGNIKIIDNTFTHGTTADFKNELTATGIYFFHTQDDDTSDVKRYNGVAIKYNGTDDIVVYDVVNERNRVAGLEEKVSNYYPGSHTVIDSIGLNPLECLGNNLNRLGWQLSTTSVLPVYGMFSDEAEIGRLVAFNNGDEEEAEISTSFIDGNYAIQCPDGRYDNNFLTKKPAVTVTASYTGNIQDAGPSNRYLNILYNDSSYENQSYRDFVESNTKYASIEGIIITYEVSLEDVRRVWSSATRKIECQIAFNFNNLFKLFNKQECARLLGHSSNANPSVAHPQLSHFFEFNSTCTLDTQDKKRLDMNVSFGTQNIYRPVLKSYLTPEVYLNYVKIVPQNATEEYKGYTIFREFTLNHNSTCNTKIRKVPANSNIIHTYFDNTIKLINTANIVTPHLDPHDLKQACGKFRQIRVLYNEYQKQLMKVKEVKTDVVNYYNNNVEKTAKSNIKNLEILNSLNNKVDVYEKFLQDNDKYFSTSMQATIKHLNKDSEIKFYSKNSRYLISFILFMIFISSAIVIAKKQKLL